MTVLEGTHKWWTVLMLKWNYGFSMLETSSYPPSLSFQPPSGSITLPLRSLSESCVFCVFVVSTQLILQTGIRDHTFIQPRLKGIHSVALGCTYKKWQTLFVWGMTKEILREKNQILIVFSLPYTWSIAAWRGCSYGNVGKLQQLSDLSPPVSDIRKVWCHYPTSLTHADSCNPT